MVADNLNGKGNCYDSDGKAGWQAIPSRKRSYWKGREGLLEGLDECISTFWDLSDGMQSKCAGTQGLGLVAYLSMFIATKLTLVNAVR